MNRSVSFVVPVRNDAARLGVCLASIVSNTTPGMDVEIVVVDNGSTDSSRDVARRLGAVVVEIGEGRVSSLRNRGAAIARGDILAFIDADNEIVDGWLSAARDNLETPGVAATGALYTAPLDGTWVQRAYGVLRGLSRKRQDTDWLGSGNLAVTRRAFETVSGFDASLEACEDVDFCLRLNAAGLRLLADPRMGSTHHGDPRTLTALFVGELWRGRDNLKVTFRRPVVWSGVPSALIGVLDLGMLAAIGIGLLGFLFGWTIGLPVAAAGAVVVVLGSAVRAIRALLQEPERQAGIIALMTVTLVYDVARALAIVAKTPHHRAQTTVATVTS